MYSFTITEAYGLGSLNNGNSFPHQFQRPEVWDPGLVSSWVSLLGIQAAILASGPHVDYWGFQTEELSFWFITSVLRTLLLYVIINHFLVFLDQRRAIGWTVTLWSAPNSRSQWEEEWVWSQSRFHHVIGVSVCKVRWWWPRGRGCIVDYLGSYWKPLI